MRTILNYFCLAAIVIGLFPGSQIFSTTIPQKEGFDVSGAVQPVVFGPHSSNSQAAIAAASGPLFVDPDNPRYFTDGTMINGKYRVVFLTGSHTWCNFMDCDDNPSIPAKFDYTAYLDFLKSKNHNFFRLWRAENARGGEAGDNFWFAPMPYQRSNTCCAFDGGNKFDLSHFNQAYFDRMRQRIIQAGDQGIYVSIMLFDGWSVESKFGGHEPWKGHPYKLSNNVNNINGDVNNDGQGGETHTLANSQVTALQEAYVRKVIDTVDDLDNVLYEISNESPANSEQWQYHMINYVRNYEAGKPQQHPVGMTWEWPNDAKLNQDLYNSPADWISPGGAGNLDTYSPPVTDGSKVILADTDHLCGICGSRQWVWKSFTRGENPIFMDIYDIATSSRGMPFSNPNEVEIRNNLGYVRSYATRMNLTAMLPTSNTSLCSTGYCLRRAVANGAEYLVYRPASSGNITVDLSATSSSKVLSVEWFNPVTGATLAGGTVNGGASRSFTPPFSNDAVLYIYDVNIVSFLSDGTNDGWLRESSETSGKAGTLNSTAGTVRIGDDVANRQFRAILSFDTNSLPDDAIIASVSLKFKYAGKAGTLPFSTHGKLLADICDGAFQGDPVLQLGDFNAKCPVGLYKSQALIYSNVRVDNWYSKSLAPSNFQYINLGGVTQFRLRFQLDDNNDSGADQLLLYSGNAADQGIQPELEIKYYIP